MKSTIWMIPIATLTAASGATAHAGAESHGGQALYCPGKKPVLLDYYQATLPTAVEGNPVLVDISTMTAHDILTLIQNRFENHFDIQHIYNDALQTLGPLETWLEASLTAVSDSDPAFEIPPGCSLKQVAIRQDSTVYVDSAVLADLSPAQQGLLVAHEALYYIAVQNGHDSSAQVRMVMRNLLMKNLDVIALSRSVHDLGNRFFWWEQLASAVPDKFERYLGYDPVFKKTIDLKIFYNPMLNGKDMDYYYSEIDNSSGIGGEEIQGTLTCDDAPFSKCHTLTGPHTCALKILDYSSDSVDFDLVCSDNGLDIPMLHQRTIP